MTESRTNPIGWPTRRVVALTAGMVVVLGVAGLVWWQWFAEPAPAWRVRGQIDRFLKKQTRTSNFSIEFPFPPKEAMARAPKSKPPQQAQGPMTGPQTGKDFNRLCDEYLDLKLKALVLERQLAAQQQELTQTRGRVEAATAPGATNIPVSAGLLEALQQQAAALAQQVATQQQSLRQLEQQMAPLLSDLWAFQRAWRAHQPQLSAVASVAALMRAQAELQRTMQPRFEQASTYGEMYELIGQQLWVARRLFASALPEHRRVALSMVRQAAWDTLRYAQNPWLAARIYEGYVLPNLDLADMTDRRAPLSIENLANDCARVFRQVNEPKNILRTWQRVLAVVVTPQGKDWARVMLAQAYEQQGQFAQALHCLRQVQRTNDFAWALRRVPWLQQQAQTRR